MCVEREIEVEGRDRSCAERFCERSAESGWDAFEYGASKSVSSAI